MSQTPIGAMAPWGLHWFRRDLRLTGNPALRENFRYFQGRTLGVFCFDDKFLAREDFSANRFAFFLQSLEALRKDLQAHGGDLLVVSLGPDEFFSQLWSKLSDRQVTPPAWVSWNRDYEPFARDRDARINLWLQERGVEVRTERDHLLFEPHEVMKADDPSGFYQVYSPFSRAWWKKLQSDEGAQRIKTLAQSRTQWLSAKGPARRFSLQWKDLGLSDLWVDAWEQMNSKNSKRVSVPIPAAGFSVAFQQAEDFRERLTSYRDQRDFPGVHGTSQLSRFFKNGSLTGAQCLESFGLQKLDFAQPSGRLQFLKELIWREFYYSILFHRPDVETQSFLPQYRRLDWPNRQDWFLAWCKGETGFPIVDAGMRELATTGWMHNRVRMIVASFLTKDLLVDWRRGERHFMQYLLDGDLAPNNGGWQWAASTGCDPQPYFRIFNPWLQGQKFDPEGIYIKKFLPELAKVKSSDLHDPEALRPGYPRPIVNHSEQRDLALQIYKSARSSGKLD